MVDNFVDKSIDRLGNAQNRISGYKGRLGASIYDVL
jgi:hypothetical protein